MERTRERDGEDNSVGGDGRDRRRKGGTPAGHGLGLGGSRRDGAELGLVAALVAVVGDDIGDGSRGGCGFLMEERNSDPGSEMTPRALKTPGLVASRLLEHDLRSGRERDGLVSWGHGRGRRWREIRLWRWLRTEVELEVVRLGRGWALRRRGMRTELGTGASRKGDDLATVMRRRRLDGGAAQEVRRNRFEHGLEVVTALQSGRLDRRERRGSLNRNGDDGGIVIGAVQTAEARQRRHQQLGITAETWAEATA